MVTRYKSNELLTLQEAERGYVAFRLLPSQTGHYGNKTELLWGDSITELPKVPSKTMRGEDRATPRVALGKSILGCVAGIVGTVAPKTIEKWLTEGKINFTEHRTAWHAREMFDEHWVVFGLRKTAGVTLVPSAKIADSVPDSRRTGEVWSLQPVALEQIGTLERTDDYRGLNCG